MSINTVTPDQAAHILLHGGVGIIPSDTVYGLAACAANPTATTQLYALKSREHKPGPVIAADIKQLVELGLDVYDLQKVSHLWPNSLSLIVNATEKLAYLHQGLGSIPVRIPKNPAVHALLLKTGPLVTSSANQPGEPVANTIDEAHDYFSETVDFYLDGGNLSGRKASTIVRIHNGTIEILRQGSIKLDKDGQITQID